MSSLVKINVGGGVFVVDSDILHARGENMITRLLHNVATNDMKREVDEHGNLFINGDPDIFAVILDLLKLGKLHVPFNLSWNKIQAELDYYCIDITPEEKDSSPCDAVKEGLYLAAEDQNFGGKVKEFTVASRVKVAQDWMDSMKKELVEKIVKSASIGLMGTELSLKLGPISDECIRNSETSVSILAHLKRQIESLGVKVKNLSFRFDARQTRPVDMILSWEDSVIKSETSNVDSQKQ